MTSAVSTNASPPAAVISPATPSSCFKVRAVKPTRAPSRAQASAMDRPMPRPLPVTKATRPDNIPMGFNPGPVDGIVGPLTENAAQQYQRARGLAVTGAVDRNLLAQLRRETPPPQRYTGNRYASNTAAAHPRPRNDFEEFFDNLGRLFRR